VRTHPTTTVTHGDRAAEVDVELAPLVLEIWRAGIETIHSCQDVGENVAGLAAGLPHLADVVRRETGRASIGFARGDAVVAFLEVLANAGPRDRFYERMVHWASPAAWQLVLGVQDQGLRDGDAGEGVDGTPLSRLVLASFQVRFPRTDADEITARLRRHNRGEAVALGLPTWEAITVDDEEPGPGQDGEEGRDG
jgi:hypothetical protein